MRRSKRQASPSVAEAINEHRYPRLLHTQPILLRAYQAAVHATTLRSWYVRRTLRRIEDDVPAGGTAVDIGCGSGDHLFYTLRRRRDVRGIGIDRSQNAVDLCRDHAAGIGAAGTDFRVRDVESDQALPRNDLTLCIGMLQYVQNERALSTNIRRSLSADGTLLLYVPVHNERIWSFYDRLVEGSDLDYDAVQGRKRIYTPDEVRTLLDESGFEAASEEFAYGPMGKAAFELHALVVYGLARPSAVTKAAALMGSVLLLPVVMLLMIADYVLPVERGNGMLVVARPKAT